MSLRACGLATRDEKELGLTLVKEEVLGSIPVEGGISQNGDVDVSCSGQWKCCGLKVIEGNVMF